MARYSAFLGRSVEVHYRAGDILLPASGTFVADSGRSIFLEQHFEQRGQQKHFRWEIPYQYIVSLEEKPQVEASSVETSCLSGRAETADKPQPTSNQDAASKASRAATRSSGIDSPVMPLRNRPKTA